MDRQKRKALLLCLPLAASLLAGCATRVPQYSRPAAPVPTGWSADAAAGKDSGQPTEKAAPSIPWQEFVENSQLRRLVELALANNRDLRVAALNIERLRALYQIKGADLWPRIDGNAGASFQRLAEDFSGTGKARNTEQYTVGLGISSYELDLFGRVRSLKEQALAQFLAGEEGRRAVQLSLVAQVANGWLALAADRERLQLAEETLASQEASCRLVEGRFKAGITTALAVSQAQSAVEAARVDIARLQALVAQDENGLALVVGTPLPPELAPLALADHLAAVKELRPGLESEVLLDRPDILQAENQLKGYNANIGVARAAFFPRITLVSSVGFGSRELSDLLTGGSFTWSLAPKVTLPLFDGGSNQAGLKVAEVDREIAVANYEKAIQTAFREVADTLAQRATLSDQLTAQTALVNAVSESLRLSQARFDQGIDSYLAVLDAQRALYSARQNLISIRQAALANRVTLYKVLGGGS